MNWRSAGRATPRELGALRDSFLRLPGVAAALADLGPGARLLAHIAEKFDVLADLAAPLAAALVERPPQAVGDADVVAPGFDAALAAQDLTTSVAKVEAVGPSKYVTDLSLLENRFQFQRYLAGSS